MRQQTQHKTPIRNLIYIQEIKNIGALTVHVQGQHSVTILHAQSLSKETKSLCDLWHPNLRSLEIFMHCHFSKHPLVTWTLLLPLNSFSAPIIFHFSITTHSDLLDALWPGLDLVSLNPTQQPIYSSSLTLLLASSLLRKNMYIPKCAHLCHHIKKITWLSPLW